MGMKQWGIYHKNKKAQAPLEKLKKLSLKHTSLTGQALLELAVFGSIALMLLGVLIAYGLRYNYQQQTIDIAFRKALKSAADTNVSDPYNYGRGDSPSSFTPPRRAPILVQHVVVRDRHIPDPSNTFGIGSAAPFMATAEVSRTNMLGPFPDNDAELPRMVIDINGQETSLRTASFVERWEVSPEEEEKYVLIYGPNNVTPTTPGQCLEWDTTTGAEYGYDVQPICLRRAMNLKIVDSCDGEIVNYSLAVQRCKMFIDTDYCADECIKDCRHGDRYLTCVDKCNTNCAVTINQIPWYCTTVECGSEACTAGNQNANHRYTFTKLNALFPEIALNQKPKEMGLQQETREEVSWQDESGDTTLRKQESNAGITTTDDTHWNTRTTRTIVSRPLKSETTESNPVQTDLSVEKNTTWQTPW